MEKVLWSKSVQTWLFWLKKALINFIRVVFFLYKFDEKLNVSQEYGWRRSIYCIYGGTLLKNTYNKSRWIALWCLCLFSHFTVGLNEWLWNRTQFWQGKYFNKITFSSALVTSHMSGRTCKWCPLNKSSIIINILINIGCSF